MLLWLDRAPVGSPAFGILEAKGWFTFLICLISDEGRGPSLVVQAPGWLLPEMPVMELRLFSRAGIMHCMISKQWWSASDG